jgi:hypothetical protein
MNSDWIKNLKAGDTIIISRANYGKTVQTVEKITPSGLIKVAGKYYDQHGFLRTTDKWARGHLEEATNTALEEIEKKATIAKAVWLMRNVTGISHAKAVKIIEILEGEAQG